MLAPGDGFVFILGANISELVAQFGALKSRIEVPKCSWLLKSSPDRTSGLSKRSVSSASVAESTADASGECG